MNIERKIMPEGSSSPDTGPTPAQAQPEQKAGTQPKGNLWRSPDFNPNATYQTKIPINPQTGKAEGYTSAFEIDPKTGEEKEMARIPRVEGGSLDVPAFLAAAKKEKTRFEQLREWTEKYDEKNIDMAAMSPAELNEYNRSRMENLQEMGDLINGAQVRNVLSYVTEDIKQLYAKVVTPPESVVSARRRRRRSSMYGEESPEVAGQRSLEDRVKDVRAVLTDYQETFWDYGDSVLRARFGIANIAAMKDVYKGISSFVASKVAVALEKDLKGEALDPSSEIGDYFLNRIKREFEANAAEVERQRSRERLNAGPNEMLGYNTWRERFEFNWAQTRPELKASVFAWLEKFVAHLPEATIEELNNESLTWKRNAVNALEIAAHDMGISEKDPFYKEQKGTIEAYVEVFRGVKFLETDGGDEAHTVALEEFAHNFNAKHDAIYLGNAKSAIIQAYLARNHGEIALGTPAINADNEKPQAGDLEDFRGRIEEQAKLYAATHELFIRDSDFEKRVAESNNGYGWDDVIEELLLVDSRGMAQANALTDPVAQAEAIAKVATRTGVFKRIKERLDKEDEARDGRSFDELSDDERKEEIRFRIRAKMVMAGFRSLAQDIDGTADIAEKDRKLWDWLKEYNERRERQGHSLYLPSNWDTVRLSINTSTKLVDRVLSQGELEAMIEEVGPFQAQVGTTGLTVSINVDGLTDEQIKNQIDSLANLTDTQKIELLEDALYDKQRRETEAERAFNINRAYQKFLGVDARWGGMAIREIDDNGNMVLITIWQKAEELLKAKIDKEEADIEVKVVNHAARLRRRGLSDEAIERASIYRRRHLRNEATFGATLGLREIGIANDLPIWNYYYYNDPQRIQTFAPLVGLTHNDKPQIVELLDRGRREMRVVFDYIADTYMDGRILIVRDEPNAGVDANGEPIAFHQERMDRARVINEAGITPLRGVFESRMMLSTSGGIEVVDLISKIGDLGIYDLLWEMGCKDFREFQGFIKRRDEVELKKQSFWNIREWRDPITYAKRLRGAHAALPYLRGGEVKGQGYKPGVLIEPMNGSYTVRDFAVEGDKSLWDDDKLRLTLDEWTNENLGHLSRLAKDKLIEIGAKVIKPLIEYMDARRYVMNRAGLAPKNWKYDNWLISEAYFKELLRRTPMEDEKGNVLGDWGAEVLGDEGLDYAILGRSPLAVAMYRGILETSSYHTLLEKTRKDFAKIGKDVKVQVNAAREQLITQAAQDPMLQAKLNARRQVLASLTFNTEQPAIEGEITRLINHYVEENLHKQVTGEWAMQFAA